jgi:hypothetical protein
MNLDFIEKKWYDDNAFYVEQKRWGTWQSHYPDGKGIITSLTEDESVRSTRWYLKMLQEGWNDANIKSYSTKDNYKL